MGIPTVVGSGGSGTAAAVDVTLADAAGLFAETQLEALLARTMAEVVYTGVASFITNPLTASVDITPPPGTRLSAVRSHASHPPTAGTIAVNRYAGATVTNQLTAATVSVNGVVTPADTRVAIGTVHATAANRDYGATQFTRIEVVGLALPDSGVTDELYVECDYVRTPT